MNVSPKFILSDSLTKVLCVVGIILFSVAIRIPTFYLPHDHGDQVQYVALAMKVDQFGMAGYNLRDVDIYASGDRYLWAAVPVQKGSSGNYLPTLAKFYDMPLYHKPPLFVYALRFSHRVFASQQSYTGVKLNLGPKIFVLWPEYLFKNQFYSVIVPFIFSLFFIFTTYCLGKMLYSHRVGCLAAIGVSISPIEILSSQRIWTEDMTAFFVTAALILYWLGREKKYLYLMILAGFLAGLAALTKPSGNVTLLIVGGYELWIRSKNEQRWTLLAGFFVPYLLTVGSWYGKLFVTYGSLLYKPLATQPELLTQPSWWSFISGRPWYMYLVNIPVQTPMFIFVYAALVGIFKRPQGQDEKNKEVFLLLWILMFLISFWASGIGMELRHIIPAFPAIALLSAVHLDRINATLCRQGHAFAAKLILIFVLGFGSSWSVYLGLKNVFLNNGLIIMPL